LARIFFPRADRLLRQTALTALVAGGLFTAAWYYYAYPEYLRVGYIPAQPIPFSHQLHAGQLGMHCQYCHQFVGESPHANVPSTQTCLNCHAQIKKDRPAVRALAAYHEAGLPPPWQRVHKVPEYAYFNHAVHIGRGVGCASCHGPVNDMPVVFQDKPLHMGFCLNCHRRPEQALRPTDQVFNLDWQPGDGGDGVRGLTDRGRPKSQNRIGTELREKYQIQPPQTCQGCHR
jgi:Cytochrome c7 and related cytochrome c/Class III cytochrome C family